MLASGYAALGAGLLPRLRGDFALLIWDAAAGTGLVARDQLGGRGLFVHRFGSGIAFASEIRQLRRLLPLAPVPDRIAVAHWLAPAAAVPGERTLFEGIEPPALGLVAGRALPRVRRPDHPEDSSQPSSPVGEEARAPAAGARLAHRQAFGAGRRRAPPPPPPPVEGPAWWSAQVEGILGAGSRMLHDTSRRHAALSGIEPRHPLLDVDLIELALSLPPELAFDRRHNRPVLRRAVEGLVPDEARLRPYKSNFDPVLINGMRADLPVLERLLPAPGAQVAAHTERDGLERHLAASAPKGWGPRREWALTIWQLATLECWLRLCAGEEALPERPLATKSRASPTTAH